MTKPQMLLIKCHVNILSETKTSGKSINKYLPTPSYRAEVKFIVTCLIFKS